MVKTLTTLALAALLAACTATAPKTCTATAPDLNCARNSEAAPKADRPAPNKPADPKGPGKDHHGGPKGPGKDHHGGPKGPGKGPKK